MIEQFFPSLSSLTIVSVFPFVVLVYAKRYWFLPHRVRRVNFFMGLFSVGTIIGITYALLGILPRVGEARENITLVHVSILHFFPAVMTLWLVFSKGLSSPSASQGAPGAEGKGQFLPVARNKEIEKIGWQDLIVSDSLKQELNSVIELLKSPSAAKKYGIEVPKGILLNGPPGTGKTTIAKVIANVAGLSFFVLKMDEIVSKWVGESEKNLSTLFKAATKHAPAVIFVDEVDSIGAARGSGASQHSENLLNHLLQLIDGVIKTEGVYIIAATNRADLVDSALIRSGRLNRVIEIPLPDLDAREKLFELHLSKLNLKERLNYESLAILTEGCSCADIKQVCVEAGLNAFRRESGSRDKSYSILTEDLEHALLKLMSGPGGGTSEG